jgi:hypothetical protein
VSTASQQRPTALVGACEEVAQSVVEVGHRGRLRAAGSAAGAVGVSVIMGMGGSGDGSERAGGNETADGRGKGPVAVGAITRSATVPPIACACRAGTCSARPRRWGREFAADQEPGGWRSGTEPGIVQDLTRARLSVAIPMEAAS